ncbi:hypothetical protein PHMEG_00011367 [Phytophthora megakarya]|uniref:Uncharacterized protein n=1 Tax=Phytophthora megakarya TaxID=4795 RepID=A0A225WD34_9STRA|nr:hypothetical protein PHMEG_00011367 [Phytophthora megakarya]
MPPNQDRQGSQHHRSGIRRYRAISQSIPLVYVTWPRAFVLPVRPPLVVAGSTPTTVKRRLSGIIQRTTTHTSFLRWTRPSDVGLCALDITAEHALGYRHTPTEIDLITDFKAGQQLCYQLPRAALLRFCRSCVGPTMGIRQS